MAKWSVKQPQRITVLAIAFEGALGVVALATGWLLGYYPRMLWTQLGGPWPQQLTAAAWGVAGTIPLLLGLALIERTRSGPLAELSRLVHSRLVPLFRDVTIWELFLISGLAGLGEELLFRGLLQAGLSQWLPAPGGPWWALLVASGAFGICHWLSHTYAVLALVVGLYLGLLLMLTGSLLTPIVAHALYDFCALVYLTRR